jgi:hypothetical protein
MNERVSMTEEIVVNGRGRILSEFDSKGVHVALDADGIEFPLLLLALLCAVKEHMQEDGISLSDAKKIIHEMVDDDEIADMLVADDAPKGVLC